MARRRRTSRSSGNTALIAGIVVLAVGIVVVAGFLGWLVFTAEANRDTTDPETFCPKAGIVAQTIVLLDTTDAIGNVTRSDALNKLRDVTDEIPRGGLLDMRVLNEDPGRIERIMHLCNPGTGADLDPLIANPDKARKRWQERFAGPLEKALDAAMVGTEQNASPILAALQQIAAELLSSKGQKAVPTHVVVISDMLEHTQYYSHFRDGLDFATYEDKAGARYLTDLGGADIDFWLVQRDRPDIDPTRLAAFWLTWAEASNGRGRVVRLMGMN